MKLNYCFKLLAALALTQPVCNNLVYAAKTEQPAQLNTYIQKAYAKEQEKAQLKKWLTLKNLAFLSVAGASMANSYSLSCYRELAELTDGSVLDGIKVLALVLGVLPVLAPKMFLQTFGVPIVAPTVTGLLAAYENYKYYSVKAPAGFKESLEKLDSLIDKKKTVMIGGKDYVLAKTFNDTADTGYVAKDLNTCAPEKQSMDTASHKKQYEVYLMPNDANLVTTFEAVTNALEEFKDDIAFIAIRPTPVLTNATKQILPRIVIVLEGQELDKQVVDEEVAKKTAEEILKNVYAALETIPNIKSCGSWPRYSTKVQFGTARGKQFIPKPDMSLVFVGMGNSDIKQLYPTEFERKKLLGIARSGDMAYPLNTPAEEKVDMVVINK